MLLSKYCKTLDLHRSRISQLASANSLSAPIADGYLDEDESFSVNSIYTEITYIACT